MVYLLYDVILLLASLFLVPLAFFKGLPHGNSLAGVRQRLGFYSSDDLKKLQGGRVFWIHAVSVGEVRASLPLIKALKNKYPDCRIVLTGMTFTGREIALKSEGADLVVFFPFDFSPIIRMALKRIRPELIVIIETEIWPNFIRLADQAGIPLVLANGRISNKSFPRYLSVRNLIRPLLEKFAVIAMQDAANARRIRALGAPPERVQVSGNMKFDLPLTAPEIRDLEENVRLQRLLSENFVWVAGSIRSGEAEILLECHQRLLAAGIPSFLVMAPRHPQRFAGVAELLKKKELPFLLRSALNDNGNCQGDCQILLVDSVGELVKFYALGQVIFVGGSLVPRGGHNLLEPAQQGKPVLFGPHVFNFKEISRLLLESGGGVQVRNGDELMFKLQELYADEAKRLKMGESGRSLIRENSGATEKTLSSIGRILES